MNLGFRAPDLFFLLPTGRWITYEFGVCGSRSVFLNGASQRVPEVAVFVLNVVLFDLPTATPLEIGFEIERVDFLNNTHLHAWASPSRHLRRSLALSAVYLITSSSPGLCSWSHHRTATRELCLSRETFKVRVLVF